MSETPPQTARSSGLPTVGVIYNPRSHRNKGQDLASDPAPHVFIAQPGDRDQLPVALERFKQRGIDLLVINGGDGTVRDALTAGHAIFGEDWPAVAVLPKGKTNALTVDLDAPREWSLQGAIDAYRDGRCIKRRPLSIRPVDDAAEGQAEPMLGFILGAGAFTIGINKGQDAHKLGAFNSLAVGVTTFWGVLSALLGRPDNAWRRGSKMDIRVGPEGEPFPRSERGDPRYRQLLFASTLERFPAGLKPFGQLVSGLKLAVLDNATRGTLLRLPMIMRGQERADMADRGMHQREVPSFTLDIDDAFILDGEAFPGGKYEVTSGPEIEFVAPR